MKVSELIEVLKMMPQNLEVHRMADNTDYDYQPLVRSEIGVVTSVLMDEDTDDGPDPVQICIVGRII